MSASLGPGGGERVLSTMANEWAARGRAVRLVTLSRRSTDFYSVDPRVERVDLDLLRPTSGLLGPLSANAQRVARIRRALLDDRPGAVISFGDTLNCLALLATVGTSLPVIVSERSDPRRLPIGRSWAALRRLLYPRARAVVVQTDPVASWARQFVPGPRVHVIPNFVREPGAAADRPAHSAGPRRMVAVGRLTWEKGHDLLLEAFAACASRHPEWILEIAGEGPLRMELEARASAAGIAERVRFLGLVRDVEGLLARSDLFILSSRFEGFPNVLLEAMSVGLACVAFDCDSGPAAIIRNGIDGVLVRAEDVESLACEMDRLMGSQDERLRLGAVGRTVTQRFGLSDVLHRWEQVLDGA